MTVLHDIGICNLHHILNTQLVSTDNECTVQSKKCLKTQFVIGLNCNAMSNFWFFSNVEHFGSLFLPVLGDYFIIEIVVF